MLVRIVNRWTYNGRHYMPGDLVEMGPDTFKHVFEVSVAEEIKFKNVIKVYDALVNEAAISPEVKKEIELQEYDAAWHFTLTHKIDDKDTKLFYSVPKDTGMRTISDPKEQEKEVTPEG